LYHAAAAVLHARALTKPARRGTLSAMAETPTETLFEKIIAKKIPATILFEDDWYIVINDIQPQAPVHLLVIPKKPIPTLNDLTEADAELVGGMFLLARGVMKKLGHTDYRTVFNCGPRAQQSVFHIHLHVLAGRDFTWPPG
jgi:histidine triad (HIT) family protein